jgi:diacylglycerol kinase (ATP)
MGVIHIVINPQSGSGLKRDTLAELRTALRTGGDEVLEYRTTGPGDATRYARSIRETAQLAIAWGGDGTVRELASGLVGSKVPVLACPVGTENLLAKELRIPVHPRRLAEIAAAGRTVECDLGVVNGQDFLLIMGIGFDGEVVRRLATVRRGHITHLSYFWPIWRTFWEHAFPRMRVIADGEEVFDDYGLAFVGNISRYSVGLRICRDARYDDGLLDLVVFSCHQQHALVLHAAWTLLRVHPLKGNVMYRQIRQARIETDRPVPSQTDGDVGPNTPVDISVRSGRIRLLVPPRRPGYGLWPWRGESLS